MAFLDTVGAKLTSFGNDVSNKTKNMVEVTNLNGQLKSCEEQLNKYYLEIGKMYYRSNDADDVDDNMKALFAKVNEANEAIDHLNSLLRKAKGTIPCPNCKTEMPLGTVFCSACGTKMDGSLNESDSDSDEQGVLCPKCGSKMKAGAVFCAHCGNKLQWEDVLKKKTLTTILISFDICLVIAIVILVIKINLRGPKIEDSVSQDVVMTTSISDQIAEEVVSDTRTSEDSIVAIPNASSSVNVRSGPSTEYQRIGAAYSDCEYTVKQITEDGWIKVDYDGVDGYLSRDFVNFQMKTTYSDGTVSYSDPDEDDLNSLR